MWERGGSRVRSLVFGLSAALTLGCGGDGDDGGDKGSGCGTISNPDLFEITNVEPAPGSTVQNSAIVHRFKIVGTVFVNMIQPAFPPGKHTAEEPTVDPTWTITQEADGASYAATALTWTMPGHVEVEFTGAYASPQDNCVLAFPSPMFSYDVTAP